MRALTLVEAALAPQVKAYVDRNPKSAAAFEQAKQSGIAGGTNRASIFYTPFPLTFVDGKGAKAITLDGQEVTDFLGNFTAGLFGYSPEPVIKAVTDAMAHGHALGGGANLFETQAHSIRPTKKSQFRSETPMKSARRSINTVMTWPRS